jgi:hypothetical protein
MNEEPERSSPPEETAGDREVDPSQDPEPRGNPGIDPKKVERVEEELDKISGN